MSKVTLINPPSPFLIDDRVFPNLGILQVATALESGGVEAEILDLSGQADYLERLRDSLNEAHSPGIYGLSATTPQMPQAIEIVGVIKNASPEHMVLLGGPHATLINAAYKWEKKHGCPGRGHRNYEQLSQYFDTIVAGDGEKAIFAALQPNAPKLIDADDRASEYFLSAADFSARPMPARKFIDLESYRYTIEGLPATSLISQLGCPFNCGFCGGRHSAMLRGSRIRAVDKVLDEVLHLHHTHGYRGFMFYDDELNVNPHFISLLRELEAAQKRLGVSFAFRGFVKAELFTPEQAEAMYSAGFRWVLSGFESGSERMLTNMRKTAALEHNTRCVEIAHAHGLKVKALMSIGHPGESPQSLQETESWLRHVRPEEFDVTIITTYPGSAYFDHSKPHPLKPGEWIYAAEKTGDRLYSVELDYLHTADFYKGIPGVGYHSYVYTDYLTREELVEHRDALDTGVREYLAIPAPVSAHALDYEHSMGMTPGGA